ncbi:hypothetical protein ACFX15_006140 [Malus domestica]
MDESDSYPKECYTQDGQKVRSSSSTTIVHVMALDDDSVHFLNSVGSNRADWQGSCTILANNVVSQQFSALFRVLLPRSSLPTPKSTCGSAKTLMQQPHATFLATAAAIIANSISLTSPTSFYLHYTSLPSPSAIPSALFSVMQPNVHAA